MVNLVVTFLLWLLAVACPAGQVVTAVNPQACATPSGGSPGGSAGGDLSGTYPNPTVAKEQGNAFQTAPAPTAQELMIFENDNTNATWQYIDPAATGNGDAFNFINSSGGAQYSIYNLFNGSTGAATAVGAIPVTSDSTATDPATVIGPAGAGTVLKSNGVGVVPSFGSPPLQFYGGANAVLPDDTNSYVFPFTGIGTAVQSSSEGTVLTIQPGANYAHKTMVCGLYNAAGTLTSPTPGTYTFFLRKNLANSTSTCTISSAARCTDASHTVSFVAGDRVDYIATPSSSPTALIPKCSSQGF